MLANSSSPALTICARISAALQERGAQIYVRQISGLFFVDATQPGNPVPQGAGLVFIKLSG